MTTLPETMRAWRLHTWGQPPELVEVPVPRPTGEEVLLRVEAAGLCHSDLHLMDAAPGTMPFPLPFTLGHEVVGTVAATGDRVGELPGRYAVHGIWACGECRQCSRSRENYCLALTGAIGCGIGRDGGLADYLLVPSPRHLVAAGAGNPVDLAPLTDAALTTFHALRPHRDGLTGSVVVVIGIGGLGHLALQLLAGCGAATVVAVDPRDEARALAARLGADRVARSVTEAVTVLADVIGDSGADLVLDFVGAPETLAVTDRLLAPGGQLVLVGSAGGTLTVDKSGSLPRGWAVSAPFWGTRDDLVEVVALADQGRLHAETAAFSLDEALVAYDRLRDGKVRGRAVVVPSL